MRKVSHTETRSLPKIYGLSVGGKVENPTQAGCSKAHIPCPLNWAASQEACAFQLDGFSWTAPSLSLLLCVCQYLLMPRQLVSWYMLHKGWLWGKAQAYSGSPEQTHTLLGSWPSEVRNCIIRWNLFPSLPLFLPCFLPTLLPVPVFLCYWLFSTWMKGWRIFWLLEWVPY